LRRRPNTLGPHHLHSWSGCTAHTGEAAEWGLLLVAVSRRARSTADKLVFDVCALFSSTVCTIQCFKARRRSSSASASITRHTHEPPPLLVDARRFQLRVCPHTHTHTHGRLHYTATRALSNQRCNATTLGFNDVTWQCGRRA